MATQLASAKHVCWQCPMVVELMLVEVPKPPEAVRQLEVSKRGEAIRVQSGDLAWTRAPDALPQASAVWAHC